MSFFICICQNDVSLVKIELNFVFCLYISSSKLQQEKKSLLLLCWIFFFLFILRRKKPQSLFLCKVPFYITNNMWVEWAASCLKYRVVMSVMDMVNGWGGLNNQQQYTKIKIVYSFVKQVNSFYFLFLFFCGQTTSSTWVVIDMTKVHLTEKNSS